MPEAPVPPNQPEPQRKPSPLERLLAKGRTVPERNRRLLLIAVFGLSLLLMAKFSTSPRESADPYAPNAKAKQAAQPGSVTANGNLVDRFMGEAKNASAADAARAKQAQDYDKLLQQQMEEQARQAQAAKEANTRLYNQIQEQQSRTREAYPSPPMPAPNSERGVAPTPEAGRGSGTGKIIVFVKDESGADAKAEPKPADTAAQEPAQDHQKKKNLLATDPALPQYILPESTVFECSLVNKLVGAAVGPVACLVSTPVYAPGTHTVIFPQGARLVGTAKTVNTFGQSRLAVGFHRVIVRKANVAGNYAVSLEDDTPGLDQQGAVGLQDKVNNHYFSTFGASLAVGAIGGLANISNTGGAYGSYNAGVQFRAGVAGGTAQASDRILDRFLNRLPEVMIRSGTRVKVQLLGDLKAPAYQDVL